MDLFIPDRFAEFFADKVNCHYGCGYEWSNVCLPRDLGNGRCELLCNVPECYYDFGDCVQLCFSPYTECNWNLFTNNVCDSQCDNEYCTGYVWKSNFYRKLVFRDFHCNENESIEKVTLTSQFNISSPECRESVSGASIYTDVNRHHQWCFEGWPSGVDLLLFLYQI